MYLLYLDKNREVSVSSGVKNSSQLDVRRADYVVPVADPMSGPALAVPPVPPAAPSLQGRVLARPHLPAKILNRLKAAEIQSAFFKEVGMPHISDGRKFRFNQVSGWVNPIFDQHGNPLLVTRSSFLARAKKEPKVLAPSDAKETS